MREAEWLALIGCSTPEEAAAAWATARAYGRGAVEYDFSRRAVVPTATWNDQQAEAWEARLATVEDSAKAALVKDGWSESDPEWKTIWNVARTAIMGGQIVY